MCGGVKKSGGLSVPAMCAIFGCVWSALVGIKNILTTYPVGVYNVCVRTRKNTTKKGDRNVEMLKSELCMQKLPVW